MIVRPPNTNGSVKGDVVAMIGDGKITKELAITLPAGAGVGVAMLLGVISRSTANTSARI